MVYDLNNKEAEVTCTRSLECPIPHNTQSPGLPERQFYDSAVNGWPLGLPKAFKIARKSWCCVVSKVSYT